MAEVNVNQKALRRWAVGVCVVGFDLEVGQVIEHSYPPLSTEEGLLVAFNCFPDSLSVAHSHIELTSVYDSVFFFRLPMSIRGEAQQVTCPGTKGEETYLYGYVLNRVRRDKTLKRGVEQKSVVILSHLPYLKLFKSLVSILGNLYFRIGEQALEQLAHYVSLWPNPVCGKAMELNVGSAVLRQTICPGMMFEDADTYGILRGLLPKLWTIWELMIVGKPLLVIAPTPSECSEAVAALVGMMSPLQCALDFRPYFTVQDPLFPLLHSQTQQEQKNFPPMILGVTNVFFLKAFKDFPHVISVGVPPRSTTHRNSDTDTNVIQGAISRLKRFSPVNLIKRVRSNIDGPLCLMNLHIENVWTSYTGCIKQDIPILNKLVDSRKPQESMSVANNEILRQHFWDLTTDFLAPFDPYFRASTTSTGMSLETNPMLPPFIDDEFLEQLAVKGPGKYLSTQTNSDWLDLYSNFLEGPNFMPWFQRRRAAAEKELGDIPK